MTMDGKALPIEVKITPQVFREFAWFDTMARNRRFVRPLAFAAIMAAFAGVCFAMRPRAEQAGLLGTVLLIVGLGLPLFYFLAFFRSVQFQENHLSRHSDQVVYTVTLHDAGVTVTAEGEETVELAWAEVYRVYRLNHSICLYANARRAWLLPMAPKEAQEAARWALITAHVPAERCIDKRR